MPRRPLTVALIGPRCSGKTSVGAELARLTGRTFVDLDAWLARRWAEDHPGAAAPEGAGALFECVGEARFRELEASALAELLAGDPPGVLATGGGVVESEAARRLLAERTWCVFLAVDPALLARRLALDPTPRPALEGADAAAELPAVARRREPLYRALADWVLECGEESVPALAERLRARLDEA